MTTSLFPPIRIPVYRPDLSGNEKAYVNQCLDSTWISSRGEFIDRFQRTFAQRIGSADALAVCNGTVAIHLPLVALGIGPGDEVIVPSLTYVAAVNAIRYVGAAPGRRRYRILRQHAYDSTFQQRTVSLGCRLDGMLWKLGVR
jgi:dTDP-4-amino-4,6-dideoxygalactose transaminase